MQLPRGVVYLLGLKKQFQSVGGELWHTQRIKHLYWSSFPLIYPYIWDCLYSRVLVSANKCCCLCYELTLYIPRLFCMPPGLTLKILFYSHRMYFYILYVSRKRVNILLCSSFLYWLVFISESGCVFCAVRGESLNKLHINYSLWILWLWKWNKIHVYLFNGSLVCTRDLNIPEIWFWGVFVQSSSGILHFRLYSLRNVGS
jgi:hypothetical protein